MDDNLQDFKESINAWGWSVNARNNFNKFIDAIETEQGLIKQIQRIQSIIDDIVLKYLEIFDMDEDDVEEKINFLHEKLGDRYIYIIGNDLRYLDEILDYDE